MNIGLTQRISYIRSKAYDCLEHGWYNFLEGHTLHLIPNHLNQDFGNLAKQLDLLIITGGDDTPLRRLVEIRISTEMTKLLKPILGVCHGAFLFTDMLGGSLKEDQKHSGCDHYIWYNNTKVLVNSYHSNVIDVPHPGANVLATDSDGNCEAWQDDNISAVVWHPERMEVPWLPDEIKNNTKLYGV